MNEITALPSFRGDHMSFTINAVLGWQHVTRHGAHLPENYILYL